MGWTFSFQATDSIRSWSDWKEFLKDKEIVDEYERDITLLELKNIVAVERMQERNHTLYCRQNHPEANCFLDPEGHSFNENEFS